MMIRTLAAAGTPWPPGPPWPPEIPPWRPEPAPPLPDQPPAPPPRRTLPAWEERIPLATDLEARLLELRTVLVTGFLDTPAATRAAAALMLLDADSDRPVQLHVSSGDGELDAAMMLAETVELMVAAVTATARGSVGGPTVAVFVAAQRRLAHPHCVFHLREPRFETSGRAEEVATAVRAQRQQVERFLARLAEATGQELDQVTSDVRAGRVLTAADAVAYGLAHAQLHRNHPRVPGDGEDSG